MKLIVGLGNPGVEYQNTRHNLGFNVVEAFAERQGLVFNEHKFNGTFVKAEQFILAKPLTFMNLSGDFVSALMRFYKVAISDLLIVYDDLSFDVGTAMLKPQGSSGGQKGMHDIIAKLGTDQIARLKVGIGAPPHDAVSHVLSKFKAAEKAQLKALMPTLLKALDYFVNSNLEAAMQLVNSKAM